MTHWIDYQLWPDSPLLMHAHSLIWLGLAAATAAFLYRRFEPSATAGLAALLFAIDDAHIMPAMWLANRNAIISVLFGMLALIAHDRWRRDGWKAGAVLAPVAFLFSLLGAEAGVAITGYLLAYILFIERGDWLARLGSATPMFLVAGFWWLTYTTVGYGARGSGLYIDPAGEPARYLGAVVTRGPVLLWGQFVLSSDLFLFLSETWSRPLWIVALALLLVLSLLFSRVLRASPTAGFWAAGMLLSVLPSCATFPSDRLLFFVGIGAMGLVAAFIRTVLGEPGFIAGTWTFPARMACWILIPIHLVVAPLGLLTAPTTLAVFWKVLDHSAATFPAEEAVTGQQVLIVNTPTAFVSLFVPLMQALDDKLLPASSLVLGSGIYKTHVRRPSVNTLVLRPHGGFLLPPGHPPSNRTKLPPFQRLYVYQLLDLLFADGLRTQPGYRIELHWLTVEVKEVTEDGRPLEVAFHFDRKLEDSSLRWIRWQEGSYVPFDLPQVGGSVTLPPVRLAGTTP